MPISPPPIARVDDDNLVRFFELSLDLFCIADLDGHLLRVNPNFSAVLGFSEDELLSQPFLNFVHPEDHSSTVAEMERLQEGLDVIRFCNRYRDINDKYHDFEWTAKVDNGVVYAVARDVSDRIRADAAEKELLLARVFQRTLIPQHVPQMTGLDIAGAVLPVAQLCGDYYDFIPQDGRQLVISVGDVAGHGYAAAMQMVELRASLRLLLRRQLGVENTLQELNDILVRDFEKVGSFVSLFLAKIDCQKQRVHYVGAGHDAFILQNNNILSLASTGMVLGVQPAELYAVAHPIEWSYGDILVAFTDGFDEAMNESGEQFGKSRVLEVLRQNHEKSAAKMIDKLVQCVRNHVGRGEVQDDMTVVVVKNTHSLTNPQQLPATKPS